MCAMRGHVEMNYVRMRCERVHTNTNESNGPSSGASKNKTKKSRLEPVWGSGDHNLKYVGPKVSTFYLVTMPHLFCNNYFYAHYWKNLFSFGPLPIIVFRSQSCHDMRQLWNKKIAGNRFEFCCCWLKANCIPSNPLSNAKCVQQMMLRSNLGVSLIS